MVGGDDVDVGIYRLGTGDVAFVEGDNGRNEIGPEDGGDGTGLRQAAGEDTGQVTGVVLVEDQASQIGHDLTLELVNPDEEHIGIFLGCGGRGVAKRKPDADDNIVVGVDKLLHIVGVVFCVLRFDVLDVIFGQAEGFGGCDYAFPSGLVEAAVVDAADVGDETDFEVTCHTVPGVRT